jgi:hypothetical protein
MKEVPVFAPAGGGHVAAVVTVPDGEPQGLVLHLAGTGRHNVIGSTLSALLSQRLAAHSLASVRLDYAGVGDSPGIVRSWTPSDVTAAAEQAHSVLTVVAEALGVSRFAEVGTCYGSRVALSLVSHPSCVGAVCLAPPIVDHGGLSLVGSHLGARSAMARIRSNAVARAFIVAPLKRLLRARKPAPRVLAALSDLGRVRLVLLYGDRNLAEDHYTVRAHQSLEAALARLSPAQRACFELRILAGGPLTTFDGLAPDEQAAIVEVVVPYVVSCFEDRLLATDAS